MGALNGGLAFPPRVCYTSVMAWSGKIYPSFHIDLAREQATFRRALALRRMPEYLGLDACPYRVGWAELGLLYYRLILLLEYYQSMPEGPRRCMLRPILAEAMMHLGDCRAAMSGTGAADAHGSEGIFRLLGHTLFLAL